VGIGQDELGAGENRLKSKSDLKSTGGLSNKDPMQSTQGKISNGSKTQELLEPERNLEIKEPSKDNLSHSES